MKRFFHSELERFRATIVLMGEKSIDVVRLSLQALDTLDPAVAEEFWPLEEKIDELEKTVDAEAIRYLTLRSPVASDLRLLQVGTKAAHELERIGDEATSVVKRAQKMSAKMPVREKLHFPAMSQRTQEMLRSAINAFLEGDEETAMEIVRQDKQVDEWNRDNQERLMQYMMATPDHVPAALDLLFVSKSLERIADHATNIAEGVLYLNRGEDLRHSDLLKNLKQQGRDEVIRAAPAD